MAQFISTRKFGGPEAVAGWHRVPSQLYDVRSAAKLLAVSPWTVRGYIRQGKLRSIRIGRLVRLDEEELQGLSQAAKRRATLSQIEFSQEKGSERT